MNTLDSKVDDFLQHKLPRRNPKLTKEIHAELVTLLHALGYEIEPKSSTREERRVYARFNNQEFFGGFNPFTKTKEFFYIGFRNKETANDFLERYAAQSITTKEEFSEMNTYLAKGCLNGTLVGVGGIIFGAATLNPGIIALSTLGTITGTGLGGLVGHVRERRKNEKRQKEHKQFVHQYQTKATTGRAALIKALQHA